MLFFVLIIFPKTYIDADININEINFTIIWL